MRLTNSDVTELLGLKREDINMTLMKDYFAVFMGQKKARFETTDKFILKAKTLYKTEPKQDTETTIGRYLVNFFVLPEKYIINHGYINEPFTKDKLGNIEKTLANMLLHDEISPKEYAEFLDNGEWISLGTVYFLGPTMNYEMNVPIKAVIERRDELFNKHKKELLRGDMNVVNKIETELIDMAKNHIEKIGNPGYEFYKSGEFKFANNYKKTSIMAGAIENPYTKKLEVLKSNYIDGITKDEVPKFNNLTIIGGYSRGVDTQIGGYQTKKVNNSMQTITLDEPDTDCKTPYSVKVIIENDVKNMFLNRYIIDKSKFSTNPKRNTDNYTLLTEANIGKYVGKEVELRSPMFCKSDRICNVCAGELYYKMGTKNAGLFSSTFSGNLMNMSMKKMHDATISFMKVEPEKFIKPIT